MTHSKVQNARTRWELAAETIAVKIRWFGLIIGYILVNGHPNGNDNQLILNGILSLGLLYAILDTVYSWKGKVFLGSHPLLISLLEAFFIAVLCYFDGGMDSSFRYFYFLSLICCAVRYSSTITYVTFSTHCASYLCLFAALPQHQRNWLNLLLMLVILGWVTWAASALAYLLKGVGEQLRQLNQALQENQTTLEERIAERTSQLQESQALVLHQEKMAALGLLAAGIAHEVGNPLTSISSLVQLLQRQSMDEYTEQKLQLVSGQLRRIRTTLRELINFSRPASDEWSLVSIPDIIEEALNIAKYYKRTKEREINTNVSDAIPLITSKRNALVQAVLNLVLNAVDATSLQGIICIRAEATEQHVLLAVEDNGSGIQEAKRECIFRPYFTTKPEGTGLGLFVTRKLITDMGGDIEFTSMPGQGTTFTLLLPFEKSPEDNPEQRNGSTFTAGSVTPEHSSLIAGGGI